MSKKDKIDFDEEFKRISRKTDVNVLKSEIAFENRLKKLDDDIKKTIKTSVKEFDASKKLTEKHVTTDYTDSSLERYKKKLNKI